MEDGMFKLHEKTNNMERAFFLTHKIKIFVKNSFY